MYSSMFTTTFLGMFICIRSEISAHLKKHYIEHHGNPNIFSSLVGNLLMDIVAQLIGRI